jgi:hypothetical protein
MQSPGILRRIITKWPGPCIPRPFWLYPNEHLFYSIIYIYKYLRFNISLFYHDYYILYQSVGLYVSWFQIIVILLSGEMILSKTNYK